MWLSWISTSFFYVAGCFNYAGSTFWKWQQKNLKMKSWSCWNKYKIMGYLNLIKISYWWKWVSVRLSDIISNLFLAKTHPISTLTTSQRTIKLHIYEQVQNAELSSKTKVIVILYTQTTIMLCYLNFRYLST